MLRIYTILLWYTFANAKEPELPPCPANVQYLPQNLPMHCRMPVKVEQKNPPFQLPPGFQFIQGMQSLPGVPMPAALPGMPAALSGMPAALSGMPAALSGMPAALPGLPANQPVVTGLQSPPLSQPMPPMPGIPGLTAPMMPQKLPVVVMPYYSPVSSKKDSERKHRQKNKIRRNMYVSDETSDVDSNGSTSDEDARHYNARRHRREKRRKHKQKKPMLTPLLQYVTKDGYVIYEKKISNVEAKKWLSNGADKEQYNKQKYSEERLKEGNFRLSELDKQKIIQARKMSKSTRKN